MEAQEEVKQEKVKQEEVDQEEIYIEAGERKINISGKLFFPLGAELSVCQI